MTNTSVIDHQIINYLGYLSEKKKKALLTMVKTFTEEPMSLWGLMPEEVKKGVKRSMAQSEEGLGKTHEEIMKKYKKWLKK